MSLIAWSLTDTGFNFSSSHFAKLIIVRSVADSIGRMTTFFLWVFERP